VLASLVFLLPAGRARPLPAARHPDMPSAPYDLRRQQAEAEEALLVTLRARIAAVDPNSETARQGQLLLGRAERNRGNLDAAAEAWRAALAVRADPQLAGDLAELEIERGEAAAAAELLARRWAARRRPAAALPERAGGGTRRAAGRMRGASGRRCWPTPRATRPGGR
jgi:cytochrome c-type biogenesis protein CcmH